MDDRELNLMILSEYEWKNNLRYVGIYFDTPTFNRITKDRAAKFEDKLSAIGGTMGLLTGFSLISGMEILYFTGNFIWGILKNKRKYRVFFFRCIQSGGCKPAILSKEFLAVFLLFS